MERFTLPTRSCLPDSDSRRIPWAIDPRSIRSVVSRCHRQASSGLVGRRISLVFRRKQSAVKRDRTATDREPNKSH